MPDRLPHMLRADAQDNRDRILEVARALFADKGIDITMREVARRAEVGPATLYRRFPTKQALIDAAFADEMRSCRQIVEDGCADPDPWRGFSSVIERITVLNGRNQGFVDAFMSANPEAESFTAHRAALLSQLTGLATRAKKAGGLRRDFAIDDLVLVLQTGRGLAAVPPARREASARRFATLVIDAFRASGTNPDFPRMSHARSGRPPTAG
ncbi:TetR/AcrR family transcriptional regulator [Nocardia testacea]|uniref:TetR/AcrR family transcriptional regulator n=1 Tax=Nocardia testacea TaxID=248551 RepID=UPI00340CD0A5